MVTWSMPIFLTIQEAETRGSLEPKSSGTAWVTYGDSTSKTKNLTTMPDIYKNLILAIMLLFLIMAFFLKFTQAHTLYQTNTFPHLRLFSKQ